MALRDIFDTDPRSKDQLREELRVHGKLISDLSSRLDLATAKLARSDDELSTLRSNSLAAKVVSSSLVDQLARHSGPGETVSAALGAMDFVPAHETDGTISPATFGHIVVRPGELPNIVDDRQPRRDLLLRLSSLLRTHLDAKIVQIWQDNTRLHADLGGLQADFESARKETHLATAAARDATNTATGLAAKLAGAEADLASARNQANFAVMAARDAIDTATGLAAKLAAAEMELKQDNRLSLNSSILKHRNEALLVELDASKAQISDLVKKSTPDMWALNEKLKQSGKQIEWLTGENIRLTRHATVHQDEVKNLRNQFTLAEDQSPRQELADLKLAHNDLRNLLTAKRAAMTKQADEIRRLSGSESDLKQALREAAARLSHVLKQKAREESRLTAELAIQKLRPDQLKRKHPPHTLALATFMQEEVLAWMFSQTHPDDLLVEQGYLHLMGDGPWDNDAFMRHMVEQDFSLNRLWELPDADIAHLVVGRNNWSKDALIAQIEARQGQDLRIYSQEMWFAAMATGRDPFDAKNPDLLKAFANGHEALEFLIGQEIPWPNVSDLPSGKVTVVGPGDLGVDESPMHLMGYRVGATSPHTDTDRQQILDAIYLSKQLPFSDQCSAAYRNNWGAAKSAQRLYRMALHIKFIVDGPNGNDWRRLIAREEWINDLAWLKQTYFRKNFHVFKWPDTHVP